MRVSNNKLKPIIKDCKNCGYRPTPKEKGNWNVFDMKCKKCGEQLEITVEEIKI